MNEPGCFSCSTDENLFLMRVNQDGTRRYYCRRHKRGRRVQTGLEEKLDYPPDPPKPQFCEGQTNLAWELKAAESRKRILARYA